MVKETEEVFEIAVISGLTSWFIILANSGLNIIDNLVNSTVTALIIAGFVTLVHWVIFLKILKK